MQTRGMKREYEVAVLDPAGNVTAIVLSDVQAAERARIAAQSVAWYKEEVDCSGNNCHSKRQNQRFLYRVCVLIFLIHM